MTNTLEMKLGIISIDEAIQTFFEHYPDDVLTKLQLAHRGPFYQYSLVGNDGSNRHSLKLDAKTGDSIENTVKVLKPKDQNPKKQYAKKLDLENMLPLSEINAAVLSVAPVSTPIQWELQRKKERTLWKVKMTDERGANLHEIKLDAQDGTLLRIKLKV